MKHCDKLEINGIEYARADRSTAAVDTEGLPCVIVRSHGAGVFCGYVRERDRATKTIVLDRCIRLWRWTGCSLSQVAQDGTVGNGENKFSVATDGHEVADVIEVIPCTARARAAIEAVQPWKL
jgi:hypothetical protein